MTLMTSRRQSISFRSTGLVRSPPHSSSSVCNAWTSFGIWPATRYWLRPLWRHSRKIGIFHGEAIDWRGRHLAQVTTAWRVRTTRDRDKG